MKILHSLLQSIKTQQKRIKNIDYLLILSNNEGGPVPLLEAFATGAPVIAPDVGWCWEYPIIKYQEIDELINIIKTLSSQINTEKIWEESSNDLLKIFKNHEFLNKIRNTNENVTKHLEKNEIDKGLASILNFSDYCNQYFQKREPWKNEESKNTTLYLSINAVLSLSILLFPYIPFSIEKLLTNLNIERDKINWKTNVELFIKPGHEIKNPEILFKKIEKESIEKQKNKLGKKIK